MTYRRSNIWTRVALAVVLASSAMSTASAQGQGRQAGPPYRPAPGAKDLGSVLFQWTWAMGMLRGLDEHELVATFEYQGKGTIQVEGQPCTLTKYRISNNYQTTGERIQYTCTRANGQTYSNVEVVSGEYAWNEDIPGAELVAGKGKATALPAAVQERLIRLWASPQAAAKAAMAGVTDPPILGPNPGELVPPGVSTAGKTSVSWEGGKPTITFPIPGVPGAIASATLDAKYFLERVVVKLGSNTTEFTYSDYRDWNTPLNKIEAYYAGKMTERKNGAVVRDLTTIQTETGQVYVMMPVPASVRAATKVTAQLPVWTQPGPPASPAASQPTPRLANGKPDLTGNWAMVTGNPTGRYGNRLCGPTQVECSPQINQTEDGEFYTTWRYGPSRPVYKPELWDKIQQLDEWTNKEDPVMTCQPLGVPRQGPPRRIFQTPNDVTLLYGMYGDAGGGNSEFRVIPTDGRPHDPQEGDRGHLHGVYGRTLGWRHAGARLHFVCGFDVDWTRRLHPFAQHACDREIHA